MTLPQVLLDAALAAPAQVIVHVRGDGSERVVTLRELCDESLRVAGGLLAAGLSPGTCVPIVADRSDDFQPMFWGALAAGLVPVPLAPDARLILPVWELLGRPPVVVDESTAPLLAELPADVRPLGLAALREGQAPDRLPVRAPDDLAFLQFSSGSTGSPKGVELTHACVLANLEQIRIATALTPDDVVASWMPYFHDMGLIGTHLAPLAARAKQVKLGPLSFAKRPLMWFEMAERHRATILSAANFALALAVRRIPDAALAGLDLSRVRLLLVGAEPISPTVWREFARRTRPAGLDARAAQPVYGLAEATVAVAFPPLGEVAAPLVLDRAALSRGRAVDAAAGAPAAERVELMDVGHPVPGCAVRVVDDGRTPLGDRWVGHIEVRGPQVARGYHGLPEATAAAFADGWLRTGDTGFLRDGRLCVTGRHKDVLFINGRNFYAPDLEAVAADTPGLPPGTAAVIGSTDPVTGGERVVVFVQWARPPRATVDGVLDRVAARVREVLAHDDVRVLPLAAGAFPRTTSGKVQRQRLRARFEAGKYAGKLGGVVPGPVGAVVEAAVGAAVGAAVPTPQLRSRRDTEGAVRRIWAQVLDLPETEIGLQDRFLALGGSSLKAMQVLAALEDTFGITVRPSVLRDCDTVAALVDQVLAGETDGPRPLGVAAQRDAPAAATATPAMTATTAITGMACRFPGADTPEAWWDLLAAGQDAVTEVPAGRWPAPGDGTARWGAFLDDPGAFDAGYFGVGEEEARAIDPQARLFLELAHEALERAGYAGPRRRDRRIGVFAAVGESGHRELLAQGLAERADLAGPAGFPGPTGFGGAGVTESDGAAGSAGSDGAAGTAGPAWSPGPAGAGSAGLAGPVGLVGSAETAGAVGLDGPAGSAGPGGLAGSAGPAELAGSAGRAGAVAAGSAGAAGPAGLAGPSGAAGAGLAGHARSAGPAEATRPAGSAGSPGPAGPAGSAGSAGRGGAVAAGSAGSAGRAGAAGSAGVAGPAGRVGAGATGPAERSQPGVLALLGSLPNLIAARVAQSLDLDGPAIAVDTACSSALVALHLARRSIEDGECDIAVVGGVNLNLTPTAYQHLEAAQALSPTGRCRAFSSAADGFVPGEGGAVIVLTRLDDARRAGDPVLALVRGTAVNNDGRSLSLMAPNPLRQREVVARAYQDAGVDPGTVSYVEAHGTGTAIGDPIEMKSLAHAFPPRADGKPRLLGSVKTNLGHLLNAAGMPGLVKVVLALGHRQLPASLHHAPPAPAPALAGFDVVTELRDWAGPGPLTAGVNAFGFGGTNAHAILEQAPPAPPHQPSPVPGPHLLTLSARSAPALRAAASALAAHLSAHPALDEGDVCATANTARDDGPCRLAIVADGDLAEQLAAGPAHTIARSSPRTVFLLPSQGAQAPGYGRELYESAPAFRESLEKASELLGPVRGRSLAAWCLDSDVTPAELARTDVARPLTVAFGIALARQLQAWGVRPDAVVGHGVGEIAAACVAGALSLDDAMAGAITAQWQLEEPADWAARFGAAVERTMDAGYDTFLELGRGATLAGAIRAVAPAGAVVSAALPTDTSADVRALLETLGRLWSRGTAVDRTALAAGRARVALPTYPFQHQPSSVEPPRSGLLHRFVWQGSPVTADGGARTVALVGPDSPMLRGLAQRITAPEGGTVPDTIVLIAGPAADLDTVAALDTTQHTTLTTFHELLRQLGDARPARLIVVTEDVHATGVAAREQLRPAQALFTGLTLALPEEIPGLVAAGVDLSSLDSLADRLDALEHELAAPGVPGPASTVAWRAGRRLTRTPVAVATDTAQSARPLPADGTYLITGGGSGIGAALARDLAGRGRPTLVLAGRSPQPPAQLLEDLDALGASARYRVADVSVEADVDALLAELPALDAVFHAAGVVRPGTLRTKTPEEMAQVLAAKTRGSLLISRALRQYGHRPAVCVAFSSIASALPGLAGALGDYAAGNAFLDSFAAAERAAGRPWQSLNFAAFAETGLAAATGIRHAVAARGPAQLTTDAALTALHAAQSVDAAQLLVADLTTPAPAPTAPAPTPAPAASRAVAASASGVADVVRGLLAVALDRTPGTIPDDEPFLAMGLDSLAAVDLVKQLEKELDAPLSTTLFFEHRTIRELAAHVEGGTSGDAPRPAPKPVTAEADGGAAFPLTPVQRAFHTNGRLHQDVCSYGYVRQTISGPLDAGLLGQALAFLAERHPMLRMRIRPGSAGRPEQSIAPPAPLSAWYEIRDLAGSGEGLEGLEELEKLEEALCNEPFDLAAEPPVRAVLARESTELAHLVLVIHHAAGDGYSLNILGEELWSVYTALTQGRTPTLPPLEADFAEYADASEAARSSTAFAQDQRYWREALAARAEPPWLPYDRDPGAPPAPPLAAHQVATDPALTATLRECAATHGVSLFHLMLAAYARSLARWSGQRDVAVNVARARRETRLNGVERLVGPLADTLPLLARVDPDEPVPELAERLRRVWLESERHASLTSLDLARLLPADSRGPRTAGPAGFSFARFPAATADGCPVTVRPTAAGTASAATRLSLLCWEDGATLRFSWNFPVSLFDRATVARLAREHAEELALLAARPEETAASLAPVSVAERLYDRFRATPYAVAIDTGTTTMTYGALDRASAGLAARLRAQGVAAGDLVGLLTEPGVDTVDTVVGVVGILRAGAGWVPLDSGHPAARLADQLARAQVRTVVCHTATRALADGDAGVVPVCVDDPAPAPQGTDAVVRDPEATAYVIFTSGSTGRPKAVPITHRAMENYLDWALDTFGYHAGDRLAQTASVCFDASVRQLLAPLLVGATVVTADRHVVRDPELLLDHVEQTRITVWSSVPTLWEQLLTAAESRVRRGLAPPDLSALRWIHVGGEALPAAYVRRWYDLFGAGQRIANLYGPTEATINATCHIIDARPGDDVRGLPIGHPVAGTHLEVVDQDGRPCAPGEPGELLIAGTGLTPGYLGEPSLTAAAFTERDGRRWYRSGDRVRRGPKGALEFLGRLDDQVKIRGHRVELGEIEAVLQTHSGVARAAVVHRNDRLTAFVEPRRDVPAPDAAALRAHLAAILPGYMLPARIELVEALPLTDTGKIDRRRLDPATVAGTHGGGTPPATVTEFRLAQIWSVLLDVPTVCREDDFFALGGDSLLVLEVFARLEKQFAVLPRPTVIYAHGTLAALAAQIDATADEHDPVDSTGAEDLPTGTGPSPYSLTPTQRGFLLAEALAPETNSAWLARLRLRGPLRTAHFQGAVDVLVARHPMLRTVFPAGARPPVQQELPPSMRLPVDFETLASPELLDARVAAEQRRRFEPWTWPLLRLRLLTVAPDEHVLLVHAHHLIGDGYSAALFGRELLAVYDRLGRGEPAGLPPLRATFRDYAALLERPVPAAAEAAADPAADAWRSRLTAPYRPPVLRTGTDGRHTGHRSQGFLSAGFTLDAEHVDGLRRLAADAGATLYAPVLTAYYRALTELTGQQDLVLGLAVSGRDHPLPDANRLFGPFAAAVPLRPGAPASHRDFATDLRRVAAEVAAARTSTTYGGNGDSGQRLPGGLPLSAQFFFTFLDFSALGPPVSDSLTLSWDEGDTELAPPPVGTDVFLAVRPVGEGLRVTLRAAAAALTPAAFTVFTDALRDQLSQSVQVARGPELDAALVGYLPSPAHLAGLVGLPTQTLPREELRSLLFPDARPRLLEELTTPLGRSGFICLPLFADELAPGEALVGHTARAVAHAMSLGARCVSLAGMIPALTGYGFGVLRETGAAPVTTGHAATAVSVVKTVQAALDATRRELSGLVVAVVGLGSIGSSSLELLLTQARRPPARLLLCDVAGSGPRLKELADDLRRRGLAESVSQVESDPGLPAAVYEADLVVTAVSGGGTLLDVDRLRPGTIVVDDSFPHCFDAARAIERMRRQRDVIVVGGGLFTVGDTERRVTEGLPAMAAAGYAAQPWLPGTIASCRLESLLHAADSAADSDSASSLPLVHGLVDGALARAYWRALEAAGVRAAPLHLLNYTVDIASLADFPRGR
ncbi:amino acid adenylation domain-containing protein [Streptomyces sp. NPDC052236]|uniref:amino acid adenylation domain-containing protein n=1 Tax=Streptomyces sp. NPDC052236 TaxID=3365686 RepID=UPI0037D7140F